MQAYRIDDWAATEFGQAALGDIRRTARLVHVATVLGAQPTASLPAATADPATLKAAYRFFDNQAVDPAHVLASHLLATTARLQTVPLVLAVQDTTLLDWTHHPATTGLGPLATATTQGLLTHTTLAITPERLPLGLLAQEVWARDGATYAQQSEPKTRAIAAKESQKWLTSLAAVHAARDACPTTQFVSVGDAEADLYDLFLAPRTPGVDLLVRAAQKQRRVAHPDQHLWAALAHAPVATTVTLTIPRHERHPARTAQITIRWQALTLLPPKHRAAEALRPVAVWAVWAVEETPPEDVDPVTWILLTTVPVTTTAAALERLDWYACRWGIEVWHKILKSGCQIEARQLATGNRLRRCLAVYSVIAWRILYTTMLARVEPEVPCPAVLEDDEWHALWVAIHRQPTPPVTPPTLRQAVRWIAQLGGFLARKRDGEPGVEVIWKGFQHLVDLSTMYRIMSPVLPRGDVGKG